MANNTPNTNAQVAQINNAMTQPAQPQQNTNAAVQKGAEAQQIASRVVNANRPAQTTQEATGGVYFVGANGQNPKGLKAGDQVVTANGTYRIDSVNPDGSYRSTLYNQNQNTSNYTGPYANHTGNVYQVGSDGRDPSGLKVGDQVVSANGTYTITGVNADGSYSKILSNRGQTSGNYSGSYATAPTPYNKNVDYSVEIKKAVAAGDMAAAAWLEQQRNAKIKAEGLQDRYPPTNDYVQYLSSLTQDRKAQLSNGFAALPSYARGYNRDVDYSLLIEQARAAGDLPAAAYYEQLRNAKIQAEGLQNQYAPTNEYSQYLDQLTPERKAQLASGYVRDTSALRQNPGEKLQGLLDAWLSNGTAQIQNQVNYATEKGVNELQRAMEDAQPKFQEQLNQNDIDTARALDNSAFYAEARGDRGGIGQSQYNEIQAAALKNRQAIYTARTKLATDTARQIADLRAQGQFEAADKVFELGNQYLSKLFAAEQWAAEFGLTQEQALQEIEQSERQFQLQVANITGTYNGQPTYSAKKYEDETTAALAEMKLKMGVMPTDAELASLHMTPADAQAAIWNLSGGTFSAGGSYGGSSGSSDYSGSGGSGSGGSGSGGSGSGGSGGGNNPGSSPNPPKKTEYNFSGLSGKKDQAPTKHQKTVAKGEL